MSADHEHRVCTYREAEDAVRAHSAIYVNDCFCRGPAQAAKGEVPYCGHPVRTCMGFKKEKDAPFEVEEFTQARALALLEDWSKRGLFFRFMMDEQWICLCCSCGCGFFFDKEGRRQQDPCGKSGFIERTDGSACRNCGACVKVCAWEARRLENGRLRVTAAQCYGCGACEHACPSHAVSMVPRGGRG